MKETLREFQTQFLSDFSTELKSGFDRFVFWLKLGFPTRSTILGKLKILKKLLIPSTL